MVYDCFLSHQHDDFNLVEAVAANLEELGLKCWYAPRDVKGRYPKAIYDGISSSKVFVLILNERSAVAESVLNEVEIAHNISKTTDFAVFQPICTDDMDINALEYQEMMYYIRRMHIVNVQKNLCPEYIAKKILDCQPQLIENLTQRQKSRYIVQDIEDKRLAIQNEILKKFDDDIYQNIFEQYPSARVLDVGCGRGDMLIPKLENHTVSAFVGIDRSETQINVARKKYSNQKSDFIVCDVESEQLEKKLRAEMDSLNIESFDIINISMLLLHINDPTKLLTRLRDFLSENGTVIIRDIDDGINFAFPDPQNAYERIYKMCDRDEQSGNRRNGRQIYSALYQAGYKNIRLERQGLSNVDMTEEEKDAFFGMYFPFTLENAKIMSEKYSWNSEYKNDYLWFQQNFSDIHENFLKPDFVFSLGFMIYTAGKQP